MTRRQPLTISSNERPKFLIDDLKASLGEGNYEVGRLDCADYALGTDLGVERKRADNLVSSLVKKLDKEGRPTELDDQMRRCLTKYKRVVLLVEGHVLVQTSAPSDLIVDGRIRHVPYMAVQAKLLKLQEKGVRIIWTDGMTETIATLVWLSKGSVV